LFQDLALGGSRVTHRRLGGNRGRQKKGGQRGDQTAENTQPDAPTMGYWTGAESCEGHCFTSSTRRFLAWPSGVELSAIGLFCPNPLAVRREAVTPCEVNHATTA